MCFVRYGVNYCTQCLKVAKKLWKLICQADQNARIEVIAIMYCYSWVRVVYSFRSKIQTKKAYQCKVKFALLLNPVFPLSEEWKTFFPDLTQRRCNESHVEHTFSLLNSGTYKSQENVDTACTKKY